MPVIEYVRSRPLCVMAPAAIVGVALSANVAARWPWVAAGIVAAVAVLAVTVLLRRGALFGVLALGLAAGFARHEVAEYRPPTDVAWAALPEERVRVRGTVLDRPRFYQDRAAALEETEERHEAPTSGAFNLEIVSIEGLPNVTGRLRVQFYDRDVDLIGGEELVVAGKLRHPRPRSNPGGADRRAILARDGIGAVCVVGANDEWVMVKAAPIPSPRTVTEEARDAVRGTFFRHARPEAAALLSALLIGSRENLPDDLVMSLQRSGTAHFLAISGQNLAIVLMLVAGVLTLVGLRGPRQHALTILLLLGYTALSGWQVSVVRAFLMATVWLGAHLVWRRSDSFNSMCAAALAIVLADPIQVFQPGFQLSFLAVLGILFVAPVFHDFLTPAPPETRRWWHGLARQTRGVLAISMAAWLATAPVVLANFNLLTPIILVANLVLVPLILIETGLAIALVVVAPVAPPLADAVGWLAGLVLDGIGGSSGLLTRLPGSYLFSPALPAWGVAAYYVGVAGWTFWARVRPGGLRPWLCVAFGIGLALPGVGRDRPESLLVAMMDVGRGSSIYVEWPDGRNLVFDCGSLTHRDVGATVVAPYLWSRGVRRVDTLVLSHPDEDHTNGAWSLVERMRIRRLVATRHFPQSFLDEARSRGLEVVTVERTGPSPVALAPGIEVLGPPTWEKYGIDMPRNESSVTMRLEGRVLLTGDITDRGSVDLLEVADDLAAEVFVVPHHGRRYGMHRAVASAVAPSVALISAGEGQESAEVAGNLEGFCGVYRTGRDGCIEVRLESQGAKVRGFLR